MTGEIEEFLTRGLEDGYAGGKKPESIFRRGFAGKGHVYYDQEEDETYCDQWFADDNGGGQELVHTNEEYITRLYGGGVISKDELQKLGITSTDIIKLHLIPAVRELGGKTRLYEPVELDFGDGWNYKYSILKQSEEVPLTVGYESIEYKGREVFAHAHIISPIK